MQDKWSIKIGKINNIDNIRNLKTHITAKDVKDIKAEFVADPFLIKEKNKWYVFYEVLKSASHKGVIAYSESFDLENWEYGRVVLEEEWHLSYPYVIKWNDKFYMIPESAGGNAIILYEAIAFPNKWEKKCKLIGGRFWDSSVFIYDKKLWMFTLGSKPQPFTLRLFYAKDIKGPWIEHKKSPLIINNPSITRPGGRVYCNDKLIRYTQDCAENYGKLVRAFEITKLNEEEYEEEEIGVVLSNSDKEKSWNKDGSHNIDIQIVNDQYLVAIDGYYYKKTNKIFNKIKKYIESKKR